MAKHDPPDDGSRDSAGLRCLSLLPLLQHSAAFFCGCALLAGCATGGKQVDQAMQADRAAATVRNADLRYFVGCPDVLEVRIAGQLDPGARVVVGPDGRVDLGPFGPLRVEGQGVAEIERQVAERAGVPVAAVRVRVAEYNSQQVYLFGEGAGVQRAVAYRGEETVADLLQRAGGITAGAAPTEVQVIRPRVADGKPPLLYRVDLQAIVVKKDMSTNLRVQPFDQIYVGETHRSSALKCVPPLFRPVYARLCGLRR
jgi:protein involved in polysaccharide export with SLBB domain